MPNQGPVTDSPFKDYIGNPVDKNDSSNRSLDKTPGYKSQTESPDAPSVTHRHTNFDGGKSVDLTDSIGPDTVKKRVG